MVRANDVNHSARSDGIIGLFFSIFFNMMVCCVFSLESPHRGDFNEYKQHNSISIIKKISLNYSKYNVSAMGIFPRDSRASSKEPW